MEKNLSNNVESAPVRFQLILLLAMAVWGSTFVAMKVVVTSMEPGVAVFIRMLFAVAAFVCLLPWVFKGLSYEQGDWKPLLLMAAFEPCLYFLFESQALQYTSASQAGMITSLFPILVAVSAYFIFRERLVSRQWVGLLIALAGVMWMTLGSEGSEQAPNPLVGNLLELCAMGSALGYTLLIKHLSKRYSPLFLTALQAAVGAVFFMPFALFAPWPESIEVDTWLLLVYLGVGASIGAYGLFNYALSRVEATVAAGYVNLIPAFAVLFSVWFLGDSLQLEQWLAIGLVFIGVYVGRPPKVSNDQELAAANEQGA